MATFELVPTPQEGVSPTPSGWEGLGNTVLLQNARWFTRIRWVVVLALLAFGLLNGAFPAVLQRFGLVPQTGWPWVLACMLAAVNGFYVMLLRRLSGDCRRSTLLGNIWMQIVTDLIVLTVLVYAVGAFDTFIGFAYLFHIVLACIFFAPRASLAVAVLSTTLFLGVVMLEITAILPRRSMFAETAEDPYSVSMAAVWSLSAVAIWFVVWYLVSTISRVVRRRDRELASANRNLVDADEERTRQVLRVTHDLKAPFSGIENNIQLLRYQHWQEIPESIRDIVRKIEAKSATLRSRIRDILALGELKSAAKKSEALETVDLGDVLKKVVQHLAEQADQRRISIHLTAPPAQVLSDPKQIMILFANLVSNAVLYSNEGGTVDVVAQADPNVRVSVSDYGIGISPEALPRIFEEFYRSREAARFNQQSTGLGLAIVKQVADNLSLKIIVNSESGRGTTFDVVFPQERSK